MIESELSLPGQTGITRDHFCRKYMTRRSNWLIIQRLVRIDISSKSLNHPVENKLACVKCCKCVSHHCSSFIYCKTMIIVFPFSL